MWQDFNDFILDMHMINKEAASWFAKECLLAEQQQFGYFKIEKYPIRVWIPRLHTLRSLLEWDDTPQGYGYWEGIHEQMMEQLGDAEDDD